MPRLFVAIDLPDEHKTALAGLRDASISGRWTPPEQFHLTLRFIGDVDEVRVPVVEKALAAVQQNDFTLRGQGLGVFPSIRRPSVLFAAIDPNPVLTALQDDIEQAVQAVGIQPDNKPFHPHVTLARLRHAKARTIRAFLRMHQSFTLSPFSVTRFYLYESVLRPEGALHTRCATFAVPGV